MVILLCMEVIFCVVTINASFLHPWYINLSSYNKYLNPTNEMGSESLTISDVHSHQMFALVLLICTTDVKRCQVAMGRGPSLPSYMKPPAVLYECLKNHWKLILITLCYWIYLLHMDILCLASLIATPPNKVIKDMNAFYNTVPKTLLRFTKGIFIDLGKVVAYRHPV